jgi:hypothetical protein
MAIALAKSWRLDPKPGGLTEHGSRSVERHDHQVLRLDAPNPYPLGYSYLGSNRRQTQGSAYNLNLNTKAPNPA